MTKHPLTDEIIDQIQMKLGDDMRAAADWQLEQVIEWLESELGRGYYLNRIGYDGHEVDVDYVVEDLKEAMRPQENN